MLFCPLFAYAAIDSGDGITVSGDGTVKAPATVVEIAAVVSGEGELAADANVKYLDAKKKGLAALDDLKIPDLTVESDGPAVTQSLDPTVLQAVMNGQPADTSKAARVQVSESLRLVLKNADKMPADQLLDTVLKIIDVCRDAGIQVGPVPNNQNQSHPAGTGDGTVTFKLADKSELEQAACQKAVEEAKAKAKRLADLTGVQLGRVLAVDEEETPPDESSGDPTDPTVGGTPLEIPVSVHVTVKFEITR